MFTLGRGSCRWLVRERTGPLGLVPLFLKGLTQISSRYFLPPPPHPLPYCWQYIYIYAQPFSSPLSTTPLPSIITHCSSFVLCDTHVGRGVCGGRGGGGSILVVVGIGLRPILWVHKGLFWKRAWQHYLPLPFG
jgi:hypothetical protein